MTEQQPTGKLIIDARGTVKDTRIPVAPTPGPVSPQQVELGEDTIQRLADKIKPSDDSLRGVAEATAAAAALVDELAELRKDKKEKTAETASPESAKPQVEVKTDPKLNWQQAQDVLDAYAEKMASGKKVTANEEAKADFAVDERNRLVETAKTTGVLDSDMKKHAADMMNYIVADYPQNIGSGRNQNPRELLQIAVDAMVRSKGEPSGELHGIRSEWYEGIVRNVDRRILEEQITLRRALEMPESVALTRELREAEERVKVLNWGNLTQATRERLTALAQTCADWAQRFGPEADDYRAALQRSMAKQGPVAGAGNENYMDEYYKKEALYQRAEFDKMEYLGEKAMEVPTSRFFYMGLTEAEKTRLELRIRLNTARVKKFETADANGYFPALADLERFSRTDLEHLTSGKGIAEAIALYTVFVVSPDYPGARAAIADSKVLSSKTDAQVNAFRTNLKNYLKTRLTLTEEEAGMAERVAKNFIDVTNLLEFTDSKYSPGYEKEGRSELSRYVCGTMWDTFNIKEKMLAGAKKNKPWPKNLVGDWAVAHKDDAESRTSFLPEHVAPDFLSFMGIKELADKSKWSLKDELLQSGKLILDGKLDEYAIPWLTAGNGEGDNPFFGYYLARVHRAATIFTVFEAGEAKKSWEDIIKASVDLGLTDHNFRLMLVYLLQKSKEKWIRPTSKTLLPDDGTWQLVKDSISGRAVAKIGFLENFKRQHPGFI